MKRELRNNLLLLFASILFSLLFLEIGLRIFISYQQRYFIVEAMDGIQYYRSNPNSSVISSGQSFLKNKPEGTYRIFTFGGSTTEGSIHGGKVSFSRFLKWNLENLLPSVPIEIINFGKAGEASRDVLRKVKIALKYEPDLFIIYSGHNEFIRFDETSITHPGWIEELFNHFYLYKRLFKRSSGSFFDQTPLYLSESRTLEDKLVCTPEEFGRVQEEYKRNIQDIVRVAKDANVDIILSTVVGNYKGWEPNRSVHKKNLSDKELERWRYYYSSGKEFYEKEDFESAIEEFELAQKIDPTFAELNFRLGKSYEQVGRFKDAKREYSSAADNEGDPKIASTLFNEMIKKTCLDHKIPCVDVVTAFESVSENSLIGYNIMVDAHHPSIFGELVIAKEIVEVMANNKLPVPAAQWSFDHDKPDKWYLTRPDLTGDDDVLYHQNRGLWFAKLSSRRYDPEDRLKRAKYHFEEARKIDPTSFRTYIGFAVLDLLEKKPLQAIDQIQKTCEINPAGTVKILKDRWISNLFLKNQIQVNGKCQIETL